MPRKKATFQALKWEVEESEEGVLIYIHGLDQQNRRVVVKVPDFKPYVYLELDPDVNWTTSKVELLRAFLRKSLHVNYPVKDRVVSKAKNYYLKPAKFVWMAFNNKDGIRALERVVRKRFTLFGVGNIKLTVHEQRADPTLQLFAMRKVDPSGWMHAKETKKASLLEEHGGKFSTCDVEVVSSFRDISPAKDINHVVNPLILSYDIECVSGDKSGNTFPNPTRKKDEIICISATVAYSQEDDESKWKTYCLVNASRCGECPDVGDGSEIRNFKNEKALLIGWQEFINEIDPDVITGYNTLSFDDHYLAERANVRLCWPRFSKLGRIIGQRSKMQERRWSSSAYGDQKFEYIDIQGRLHIDMFPVISKEFTNLMSYTLKFVSEKFLDGDRKIDLPAKDMIQMWYAGGTENIKKIVEYCNKDTDLPLKLMKKLGSWLGLTEMSNVMSVPVFDLITRGQQIRVFSQIYRLCYDLGVVCTDKWTDYRPTDAEKDFQGATVQNPRVGFWKLVATYDFKSLYPTTIIAYNICFSTFVPPGENPPAEDVHDLDYWEHSGCIGEGTLITTDKYSIAIEELCDSNSRVLAWNDNGLDIKTQSRFFNQGIKDCVELTFRDGTKLVCTPDHRIMTETGEWCEAENLIPGESCVQTGIQHRIINYAEDINICNEWSLTAGDFTLETNTVENIEKTFAYMRILGYCLTDGNIAKNRASIWCGHQLDVKMITNDLNLLCGEICTPKFTGTTFKIHIPRILSKSYLSIEGLMIGNRMTQDAALPNFILNAPRPIVREFLSGMYGGDGHSPTYSFGSKVFSSVGFSWTRPEEYKDSLITVFSAMQNLLLQFGITSTISTRKTKKDHYESLLYIPIADLPIFHRKIGYAYCCHKQVKLDVIANYYNYKQRVISQYDKVVENFSAINVKSATARIQQAIDNTYKDETALDEIYSYPTYHMIKGVLYSNRKSTRRALPKFIKVLDYMREIGAYDYVINGYGVPRERNTYPTFRNKLISIKKVGPRQVYDLEVDDYHSFVAGGVVVHNCEHDTAIRKTKVKKVICRHHHYKFYKAPVKKGIVPTLLEGLLAARANTRKEIARLEKELKENTNLTDSEKLQLKLRIETLDKRQLGYKVSANSMYGGFGSDYSYTPFYPAAAATTAMGRKSIQDAIDFSMEYRKDTVLVYGDSVTGDTPILLRKNGTITLSTIAEIGNEHDWVEYESFKPVFTEPIDSALEYHAIDDGPEALLAARHVMNNTKRWSKEQRQPIRLQVWSDQGWVLVKRVIRHKTSKKIYRVTTRSGSVDVTQDHSLLTETGEQIKPVDVKVGDKLLHCCPQIPKQNYQDWNYNSKLSLQSSWLTNLSRGLYPRIETNESISASTTKESDANEIINIEPLGKTNDYVYDLETACGRFQAGIGELIVKNTDSCMLHFSKVKSLKECFAVCEEMEDAINAIFPKPMYLELEKIYSKYFLLTKKRYVGYIVDPEGNLITVDKKGVVTKRRDGCQYLRDTYSHLIDLIMAETPRWKIFDYICGRVKDLIKGNVKLEDLIISKSIRENYKNKNLPHVAVAEKMRSRGKYVASGTRVPYIFAVTENNKDPQYKKAEDPDYYEKNPDKVTIDYLYYFEKQLVNPIDEAIEVNCGVPKVLGNLLRLIKKNAIRIDDIDDYFNPKFVVK